MVTVQRPSSGESEEILCCAAHSNNYEKWRRTLCIFECKPIDRYLKKSRYKYFCAKSIFWPENGINNNLRLVYFGVKVFTYKRLAKIWISQNQFVELVRMNIINNVY
jgi:hypothetical protein